MKQILAIALTLSTLFAAGTAINIAATTGAEAEPTIKCGIYCAVIKR